MTPPGSTSLCERCFPPWPCVGSSSICGAVPTVLGGNSVGGASAWDAGGSLDLTLTRLAGGSAGYAPCSSAAALLNLLCDAFWVFAMFTQQKKNLVA